MTLLFLITYIVLFSFVVYIQNKYFKSLRTPLSYFSLLWCVIGFVANLGLYDYYLPSDFVNFVIIAGIVIYTISIIILFSRFPSSFFRTEIQIDSNLLNVNRQIVLLINTICLVFEFPIFIKALSIIKMMGMAYVRANANEVYGSIIVAQISETLVKPTIAAVTLLAIILSVSSNIQTRKWLIVLAVIDNVVLAIVTAGRSPFVNAIFYLMICMLLMNGNQLLHLLKEEKKNILYLVGAIIGVLFLSSLRAGEVLTATDYLGSFYAYYFSGPSYLSRLLETYHEYGIGGKYLWGAATLGFIVNLFIIILDPIFGGELETTINLLGSTITSNQLMVGSYAKVNAMCTVFYPFLIDWGYLGIVLGPVVLAIISIILTNNLYQKRSITNIGLYIFWLYTLIRTVFKWYMVSTDFIVIAFMLYLFTKKRSRSLLG